MYISDDGSRTKSSVLRIFIFFLQLLFNSWDFSTDAFKGIPLTALDHLIQRALAGFKRWDAVYMLHIAQHEYVFENSLPPQCNGDENATVDGWCYPFGPRSQRRHTTGCFVAASALLYRIVLRVSRSVKQSVIAVLLFSANPASIFFSAAYTESVSSKIYFLLGKFVLCFYSLLIVSSFCKRFFLTKILTPSDLLFFVFSVTSSIFPPFYASIQSKYWHVSLFGYWQLRKIPCFLMAAPAFFLVAFGAQQTWRRVRSKRLFLSLGTSELDSVFVFKVLTRLLFSSSPFPYLVLARWISDITPQVGVARDAVIVWVGTHLLRITLNCPRFELHFVFGKIIPCPVFGEF
ncbi:unnamed protein product [Heligmosomoides polygyrus]|uniref:GPI mannosyltransferase 2 n=1 Tax=Heligmosomoides polygyrus TaxID=6339 RepID=A0A3P7YZ32_HELPZ|nr:unnamed protein product [Heligmosomoides polygyrus]